ncbi:Pullulanase 1, chloroplastic-like protein [Drosera capensis]
MDEGCIFLSLHKAFLQAKAFCSLSFGTPWTRMHPLQIMPRFAYSSITRTCSANITKVKFPVVVKLVLNIFPYANGLALKCDRHVAEKSEDNLSLSYSRAYWPSKSVIAWNVDIVLVLAFCIYATGLQIPGALDELYQYDGPLGAIFTIESIALYLSSPTAQPLGQGPRKVVIMCTKLVYHYSTLRIEKCIVNDPYARGLSADGRRTLLVNLDADSLKP